MKLGSNILSLGLGMAIAWVTLRFLHIPVPTRYVSNFSLSMAPIEPENQALVAVGLLSKKSVMDAPEKKEIKPSKAPPVVPEHVTAPPAEVGPPPTTPPSPSDGPTPAVPVSTEMTPVTKPPPPPPPPAQAPPPPPPGPAPSPPVSSTTSHFMAEY